MRDPSSGRYVAFYSGMAHGKAPPCTACTDGSTAKSCKKLALAPPAPGTDSLHAGTTTDGKRLLQEMERTPDIEVAPPTYMSHSLTDDPRGAWSTPQLVLMPKPMMDINAAPVIKPDGSLVGMWRDHHPSTCFCFCFCFCPCLCPMDIRQTYWPASQPASQLVADERT